MHLRVLSGAAVAALLALTAPALADYWKHNGSLMHMDGTHGNISITYVDPRAGIAQTGVVDGTQLFYGSADGDSVSGVAFTFKRGCQPAPYDVTGSFSSDNERLTLRGYAPVRAKRSCDVLYYDKTKNSRLVFTYEYGDDE